MPRSSAAAILPHALMARHFRASSKTAKRMSKKQERYAHVLRPNGEGRRPPPAEPATAVPPDPAQLERMSSSALAALGAQVLALLAARATPTTPPASSFATTEVAIDGDLVDIGEAAKLLGMSVDWLYKNHERLPFANQEGRRVKFSRRGIAEYIERRYRR